MGFQTKKSVLAIKKETTEGTPVSPTADTDFIALQDGYSLSPEFDTLENAELTGSIGPAKPIQGFENPTASLSHYIRHSGVEGTAPGFGDLLEAAFGATVAAGTERDTVAGSTVSVINVDAGEGVEFERGEALLVKDTTNGYSIRNVLSISTDALTLAQQLSNAPASGVNLGQAVLYKPGESHPSLSVWDYRANEALVQLAAGMKVTEFGMEASAGELVNGSFSMEGIKAFWDPIEITASNDDLDFDDGGGEENVSVTQKVYRDPHELADAIQAAMDAATADNISVTYSDSTGKFTVASDGGTLSLLWDTGTNTATTIGDIIGFDTSADDTGSTSYEGDNAIDLTAQFTPNFDDSDPLVAKNNEVLLGDADDIVCFPARSVSMTMSNAKTDELELCAESGKAGSVITAREVEINIVANLQQYDADQFKRFRTNAKTQFTYNFGTKTNSNWDAGKSVNLFTPTATIESMSVTDNDGLVTLDMTLKVYVADGLGEIYMNFL